MLALGAIGSWQPAGAAEFHCRNGDLVRRIELRGPDTTEGAACEVRYWRNARAPETGRSLWRANQDTEFCAARTRELIVRLEAGGWTCSPGEQSAAAAPLPAAGVDPETVPRTESGAAISAPAPIARALEPEPPDTTAGAEPPAPAVAPKEEPATRGEARAEPSAPPAEPARRAVARAEPSASPAEPARRAVARVGPSAPPAEPARPAVARAEPSAPPEEPTARSPASARAALLDEVVEQTLHSVQELYGGQFQADLAAFGDLDGDGLEDAAVLITYQSDPEEYVQYLVAYLFNGETFQSVATRNVGGRFLDALRADLQGIADGRILVELEALDGGATCCATRRTAFALENGQLVEVDDPGAAGLDRTSEVGSHSPG